ncbi:acyltransferase domain-containing protein, partial [Rhodococcus sp. R1101]|uniref:acyltransferase domain-containing protein n=1 Tax=Rhodococcus sp. R1101 TaxID=1170698 RepID=UPI00056CBC23
MTIDETTPGDNGRNSKASRRTTDRSTAAAPARALVDKLLAGEPYALAFGGQGAPWLTSLEELSRDNGLEPVLTDLVNRAAAHLAPVASDLVVVRPTGFDPVAWILEAELADEDDAPAGPSESALTSAAVSLPGVFLTQVAALRALANQGLDVDSVAPSAVIGHSQGVLAVESVAAAGRKDTEILAIAQLIGAAATLVGRRRGLISGAGKYPMLAVANVDPERLRAIVADIFEGQDAERGAVVAIRNARRRV